MIKPTHKISRRSFVQKMAVTSAATAIVAETLGRMYNPPKINPNEYTVFSAGKIGSTKIKNRFIKAATLERAGQDGFPTEIYLQILENLVMGGVGLIITGAMPVTSPINLKNAINIDDDKYLPGLEKIADTAHQTDKRCKIIAQIAHIDNTTSPSGFNWTGKPTQGTYTLDQIRAIINSFSEAIIRSKIAGFDGAELNAHATYFLSSFLSAQTNKREDEYGGSLENRVRIVKEIVQFARDKVGDDYPIMIKMNCDDSLSIDARSENGTNIDNFPLLANEIEKAGFDAIELSGNTTLRKDILSIEKESYFADYANNLNLGIPVILTGGNRSLDNIEGIFKRRKIDFFGFARPLIREPDLVKRWQENGSEVKSKCISCNSCLSASGPLKCMQLS